MRRLAALPLMLAMCACQGPPQARPHGPIVVWAYADPGAEEWKRVAVDSHRSAIEILDGITGAPGCFRLREEPWDGGSPPGGAVVSIVDDEAFEGRDPGVLGFADPTAPAGGWLVMRAAGRTRPYALAHELAHFALPEGWGNDGHDEWGLLQEQPTWGDHEVPDETRDALREFCEGEAVR